MSARPAPLSFESPTSASLLSGVILLAILTLGSSPSISHAESLSWSASSGVAPWDASVPDAERFTIGSSAASDPSFLSFGGGAIRVTDTSNVFDAQLLKSLTAVPSGTDWAFQVEMRMISHARPGFDWGASVRVEHESRQFSFLVSESAVGFEGYNGDSFLGDASYALDTTDGFHTYRMTKSGGTVALFVDAVDVPILSVSETLFGSNSKTGLTFFPIITSNGGEVEYEVRGFAYNVGTATLVPLPSAAWAGLTLLCLIGSVRWLVKRRSHQRGSAY